MQFIDEDNFSILEYIVQETISDVVPILVLLLREHGVPHIVVHIVLETTNKPTEFCSVYRPNDEDVRLRFWDVCEVPSQDCVRNSSNTQNFLPKIVFREELRLEEERAKFREDRSFFDEVVRFSGFTCRFSHQLACHEPLQFSTERSVSNVQLPTQLGDSVQVVWIENENS
jgi:hypothetical protein